MDYIFSIVIPIFNSEKFLSDTIKSVINQKNKKTEIILVNDNSSDNSKKICLYYKKKFNFIKLINNKKNLGVGYCRNQAIKNANGKYIVFLDSDDALIKNSLNKLEKFIKKNFFPEVIPIKYVKMTYPQNNDTFIKDNLKNYSKKKLINYILKTNIPFSDCWFFVIKKEFLKFNNIIFPNSRFGESEIFVAKSICLMNSFACFNRKFYHKKDRINSLTHSSDYNTTYSVLNNLIQFNLFFNQNNFDVLKKKFLKRYIQGVFGVFTALLILRNKNEIKKLSKLLDVYKKSLVDFVKLPEKVNLSNLINKYGSKIGLSKYTKFIKDNKFSKIKDVDFKNTKIFAYCRSQYSIATLKILKEKKINVIGVIDDNKQFKNSKFLNFKTMTSNDLFSKYKNELNNIVIIITHQKNNTSNKISNYLSMNKIIKRKIFKVKY
tara:strand:- start:2461 stop:3762 length:1302 start_codon:yes stop_codon:yes gene_type:complete